MGSHNEISGKLDYSGQMGKRTFQKSSKIPYLKSLGYKILIQLKKDDLDVKIVKFILR